LLERAVEQYRESRDLEGAGRSAALLGRALIQQGAYQEGLNRVEPMVELLSWSGPSPALATLYLTLTSGFQVLGRYEEQLNAAERATEISRVVGDERLEAWARERQAAAFTFLGRGDEAMAVLQDAIRILERVGNLDRLQVALVTLGNSHRLAGELGEAYRSTERALEVGIRAGDPTNIAFVLMGLGQIEISRGNWTAASDFLERSGSLMEELPSTTDYAVYVPASLGWLFLAQGAWKEAEEALHRALELAEATGDRQALEYIAVPMAELAIMRGRPEDAIARLEPMAGREGGFRVQIECALAWAYLERGDLARATALADGTVERARKQGERLGLADALRVQGMILVRQGDSDQARLVFEEAIALARSMPYPLAQARALYELGTMQIRQGEAVEGRAHLEEARDICKRLGAQKDLEWTEKALAELDRAGARA
jgi:tetratricopeptide (TPR) repeat protein